MTNVVDLTAWRRRRDGDEQEPVQPDTPEAVSSAPGRDADGRFKSPVALSLLSLLANVARWAESTLGEACTDARSVTQEVWDQAAIAAQAEYGPIPEGRQVVHRLRKLTRLEYQWREWILIALDDERDLLQALASRTRKAPLELTPGDGILALLAVARREETRCFGSVLYDEAVARWRVHEEQARRGRAAIDSRFPTSADLTELFGSWAKAMLAAGLEPPAFEARRRNRGCPVPDAMVYFFSQKGALPTRKQLERLAEKEDWGLAAVRTRKWHEWVAAAVERAKDFPQLPAPPPYGTPPPDDWSPIAVSIELPSRGHRSYSRAEALDAIRAYLAWMPAVVGPTGASTDRLYRRFSTGHPDRPSLHAVLQYGTLAELVAIVQAQGEDRQPGRGDHGNLETNADEDSEPRNPDQN